MRQARPLAAGERVDVDVATAAELTRLPKVGPRLAKTIVADREAHGPFGGLDGLDRVAGVGPGLLKVIGPHAVFSGADGPVPLGDSGSLSAGRPPRLSAQGAPAPLNINTATATELDALPGIGPAKAAAVLQYRKEHGPFAAVEDLARVPGFGAGAVARLRDRLSVR
jgi:competence protein ComEA